MCNISAIFQLVRYTQYMIEGNENQKSEEMADIHFSTDETPTHSSRKHGANKRVLLVAVSVFGGLALLTGSIMIWYGGSSEPATLQRVPAPADSSTTASDSDAIVSPEVSTSQQDTPPVPFTSVYYEERSTSTFDCSIDLGPGASDTRKEGRIESLKVGEQSGNFTYQGFRCSGFFDEQGDFWPLYEVEAEQDYLVVEAPGGTTHRVDADFLAQRDVDISKHGRLFYEGSATIDLIPSASRQYIYVTPETARSLPALAQRRHRDELPSVFIKGIPDELLDYNATATIIVKNVTLELPVDGGWITMLPEEVTIEDISISTTSSQFHPGDFGDDIPVLWDTRLRWAYDARAGGGGPATEYFQRPLVLVNPDSEIPIERYIGNEFTAVARATYEVDPGTFASRNLAVRYTSSVYDDLYSHYANQFNESGYQLVGTTSEHLESSGIYNMRKVVENNFFANQTKDRAYLIQREFLIDQKTDLITEEIFWIAFYEKDPSVWDTVVSTSPSGSTSVTTYNVRRKAQCDYLQYDCLIAIADESQVYISGRFRDLEYRDFDGTFKSAPSMTPLWGLDDSLYFKSTFGDAGAQAVSYYQFDFASQEFRLVFETSKLGQQSIRLETDQTAVEGTYANGRYNFTVTNTGTTIPASVLTTEAEAVQYLRTELPPLLVDDYLNTHLSDY